jgi:putative membrane protein insertion efficiency factor
MRKLPAKILAFIIKIYQFALSPLLPNSCRYYPSCSEYTRQAILTHGAIKGIGLGAWRILRCNPWSKGGHDPVKQ